MASGLREMQLDGEERDAAYADRFAAGECEGLLLGTAGPGRGTVDIGFVRDVPGLHSVRLGPGVADPAPVGDCPELTLLHIGLDQRGRVDFSGLTRLAELQAPPQVGIETVAGLREVAVTGSTTVTDGDLHPLVDNPALTGVRLERGAPHHSHRPRRSAAADRVMPTVDPRAMPGRTG
ncbi:hypothetical protein GCM10023235_63000 [Kitasatospora terrestris]|uniref:Uncharacterized protein n=1 Tax=Kitasatospora terrestris TaxID=258051 RepID=A0ABP9EL81_9ACTN